MGTLKAIFFVGAYFIRKIKKYVRMLLNALREFQVCDGALSSVEATRSTFRPQAALAFDRRFIAIAKQIKVRILPCQPGQIHQHVR
jgi:hypothetical protein